MGWAAIMQAAAFIGVFEGAQPSINGAPDTSPLGFSNAHMCPRLAACRGLPHGRRIQRISRANALALLSLLRLMSVSVFLRHPLRRPALGKLDLKLVYVN